MALEYTVDPADLPLCILPDGRRIARATVEQVAAGLGMIWPPQRDVYDLVIVGAGPAGLGAVYTQAPSDSGVVGFVGTVDLTTGFVRAVMIGFGQATGMAFVPDSGQ